MSLVFVCSTVTVTRWPLLPFLSNNFVILFLCSWTFRFGETKYLYTLQDALKGEPRIMNTQTIITIWQLTNLHYELCAQCWFFLDRTVFMETIAKTLKTSFVNLSCKYCSKKNNIHNLYYLVVQSTVAKRFPVRGIIKCRLSHSGVKKTLKLKHLMWKHPATGRRK